MAWRLTGLFDIHDSVEQATTAGARFGLIDRRAHSREKLQVQLATAASLAVVYFLLWRVVRQADPLSPATFLPADGLGGLGGLATLAGLILVLSAVCGLLTVSARPQGAMLAALLGLGGVSLRSSSLEVLLWQRQGHITAMYVQIILELLCLGAVVLAGVWVIGLVRRGVGRVCPGWLWRGMPAGPQGLPRQLGPRLRCLGTSAAVATALVPILLQSADRGQIVFGLLASFTVASLIGHWVFPARCGGAALVLPIVVGILYCILGAVSAVEGNWMKVISPAQALPVDWISAGGGGAVLGFWISERLHEMHLLDVAQRQAEGA